MSLWVVSLDAVYLIQADHVIAEREAPEDGLTHTVPRNHGSVWARPGFTAMILKPWT